MTGMPGLTAVTRGRRGGIGVPLQTGRYDLWLKCPFYGLLLQPRVSVETLFQWARGSPSRMSTLCCVPPVAVTSTIPFTLTQVGWLLFRPQFICVPFRLL